MIDNFPEEQRPRLRPGFHQKHLTPARVTTITDTSATTMSRQHSPEEGAATSADEKRAANIDEGRERHEGQLQKERQASVAGSVVPSPTGWSSWFGGRNVVIGPRIGPVLDSISTSDSDSDLSGSAILDKQLAAEDGAAIQYRTCSWQKVCGPLGFEWMVFQLRIGTDEVNLLCSFYRLPRYSFPSTFAW